jgi:hypothetical protein
MAFLAEYASQRGLAIIMARLDSTPKNAPAQQFLDSLGAAGAGLTYSLPVSSQRGLEWEPDSLRATAAHARAARVETPKQPTPESAGTPCSRSCC